MALPEHGRPADEVLAELRRRHEVDLPTHGGRTWAYVYDSGLSDLDGLLGAALTTYSSVNGLDPTVFPSIVTLENDVVSAALALLGGPPEGRSSAVGTLTSGGTESCMLSVKAARDFRADTLPDKARRPELVVPDTVHPAFHKAAHYFGLELVQVPVDRATFRADPQAMTAAMSERTAMVVVSAPSYPHGVIDPVAEVAAAAAERGVLCHVDACIGGWLLPFLRRLDDPGEAIPPFDLSVPGVTSLSVDLHKYAYTAKGASLLLFGEPALRRASYFASVRWPGYVFVNSTMQSTKSAGPLAAAWAALQHLGDDGYRDLARRTWQATRTLVAGIEAEPGLRVLGTPQSSLVAFTVDPTDPAAQGVDVYVLGDELRQRGWYVQPQPGYRGLPANIHLTVTAASQPIAAPLLADLRAAMAVARTAPSALPPEELVAEVRALEPDTMTDEQFAALVAATGFDPSGPSSARLATINHLLDAIPEPARERLLVEFIGSLYRQ